MTIVKSHRLDNLNNRNVFSHTSVGLKFNGKVWDALVSSGCLSWLRHIHYLYVFTWSSLWESVLIFSSHKYTDHIRLEVSHITLFYLIISLKTLSSNAFWGILTGLRCMNLRARAAKFSLCHWLSWGHIPQQMGCLFPQKHMDLQTEAGIMGMGMWEECYEGNRKYLLFFL